MNIGAFGAGTIVSWISDILEQLNDEKIVKYGVVSHNPEKCKKFAENYGWRKVYSSYEEMMNDDAIDLIYIAVPNQLHYDMCMQVLEHCKNVVVEKPFAVNYSQAEKMIEKAKQKGVFISEALWPAFLPSRKVIDEVISSGKIGKVTGGKLISKTNVMFMDRVKKLETGGGSLLDMGPYVLGRMTDHFGTNYVSVDGHFEKLDTGVDSRDYYTVEYADGVKVECVSTIDTSEDEREEWGEIYGTNGRLWFDSLSNPSKIEMRKSDGSLTEELKLPKLIRNREVGFVAGYEHEWIAFEKALSEGKKETDEAPWKQTLTISEIMTKLREQAGIVFPFE